MNLLVRAIFLILGFFVNCLYTQFPLSCCLSTRFTTCTSDSVFCLSVQFMQGAATQVEVKVVF